MSQENVEAFKRVTEAGNRRDWDAVMDELAPDVRWDAALVASLEGKGASTHCGHQAVREWFGVVYEVLGEVHMEYSDIRDLGDRVLAFGRIRTRGEASGAVTEAPIAYVVQYENGKATRVRSYLDPSAALEAAGLAE